MDVVWTIVWEYARVFAVGGLICMVGQGLLLWTKMTTSRVLVLFVVAGAFLTAIGVYPLLVDFAGAGATIPIMGFGYSLARGAVLALEEKGALGILSGGLSATAGGVAAAIVFGWLSAVLFRPKTKT